MKKINLPKGVIVFTCLLSFINVITGYAQNLPAVQLISLRAPSNIKIDGKSTEWNNKFQAYNKSTDVFYTISNDNNNLYLVIQSVDPLISKKIIGAGITFTVNNSDKRNSEDKISITCPLPNAINGGKVATLLNNMSLKSPDEKVNDSLLMEINKEVTNKNKEIKVLGFKNITDTLISVYNEEGIKVAALFDNKKALTYELAIPLKQLGLSSKSETKFMYNLMVNGVIAVYKAIPARIGGQSVMIRNMPMSMGSPADLQLLSYPTDFWGEYTLSKRN